LLPINGKEKKTIYNIVIIFIILCSIYLAYYQIIPAVFQIFNMILPILVPFIIAFIIAELLEPLINFFQKFKPINRTIAIFLSLITTLGIISFFFIVLISRLIVELIKFSNSFPKYSSAISNNLLNFAKYIENIYVSINLPSTIIESLENSITQALEYLKVISVQAVEKLIEFLGFLPSFMILFIFALIAIFFFSKDKELFSKNLNEYLPLKTANKFSILIKDLEEALIGFLRAQLILMFLTTVQSFIGLAILGVDYAVLIAVIIGIVDALPIFGPGAVFLPWIIWEIIVNKNFIFALALLVLYTIVSGSRQILQPKIVGDSIGMHPLEALITIYAGIKLFGVTGVITFPILWVLIKAAWKTKIFFK
jgi:sporulation integral membrane protein YtvI